MNLKDRAKKLKFPNYLDGYEESRITIEAKVMGSLTLVYALSPIDLIPVLGFLDDDVICFFLVLKGATVNHVAIFKCGQIRLNRGR